MFEIARLTSSKLAIPLIIAATGLNGLIGCDGGGAADAFPAVEVSVTTASLSAADLESANGTYGVGCTARSGPWSLDIAGSATLTFGALSVVKNNAGCVLTLTSWVVAGQEFEATPSIELGSAYQPTGSAFANGAGPVAFYGNACASALTFTTDFVIQLLYSDDPTVGTATNTAHYAVRTASAAATGVPSPSYTIDMGSFVMLTDDLQIVDSATGTVDLIDGLVPGQEWVVVAIIGGPPTYATIADAFASGTPTAISGADPQVPAAAFTLVNADLTSTAVRYLIIANTLNAVSSYQLFTITFHPAS